MSATMNELYLLCGISKQAHFQALQREKLWQQKEASYLGLMYEIREMHLGMGLRKMYHQFKLCVCVVYALCVCLRVKICV
jgi:hypothetical protein